MFTDDPKWRPHYIQVVRLYWMGGSATEIASELGMSPGTVSRIIKSEAGQAIFDQLQTNTFESMVEVQTLAQAAATDLIREKIKLALYSGNESVRSKNASDVLAIAGHLPIH